MFCLRIVSFIYILALLNQVIVNSFSFLQTQNLDLINFIMHISVEKLYFIFNVIRMLPMNKQFCKVNKNNNQSIIQSKNDLFSRANNYVEMWRYTWTREGRPMPENAEMADFNRVLLIKNARLEDQGNYVCHVKRGNKARDSKMIALRLEGNNRALHQYLLCLKQFNVRP